MIPSGVLPAPVTYQQPASVPIKQFLPIGPSDEIPQVTLMLSVPAVVPPGTSVTVTVQVANSKPNGGTVVSVSNPVVSSPGGGSTPAAGTSPNDAVVVDANASAGTKINQFTLKIEIISLTLYFSGPSVIDNIDFPEDFDNREPPSSVLLPFDNPKDSPVLIALQEEAIKQQMLAAALRNRKIA